MSIVLDRPGIVIDENPGETLGSDIGWPSSISMIYLGNAKYAAVNVGNVGGQDGVEGNFLACFESQEDVDAFEVKYHFGGQVVQKSFSDAREIAVMKDNIHGLSLQRDAQSVQLHWVK